MNGCKIKIKLEEERDSRRRTSIAWRRRIMLGWLMVLRISISLNRLSLTLGLRCSLSISLMATTMPDCRCRDSHTTAYEPEPILGPSIYSPTTRHCLQSGSPIFLFFNSSFSCSLSLSPPLSLSESLLFSLLFLFLFILVLIF